MKCVVVVGLLCLASVLALDSNVDLARCKRIMCNDDDICSKYEIDANGCPTCKCETVDPCKSMTCTENQVCIPEPEPHCTGCPAVDCLDDCPFGFKVDNNRCETCACKTDPCQDFKCAANQICQAFRSCAPDEGCDMEPKCVGSDVEIVDPEPPESPCPMPECSKACQFGYQNNAKGCMTCECNTEPCQGHKCPEGSECVTKEAPCDQGECPIEAHCTVIPMCKKMRQLSDKGLECDETGTFNPLQCESRENMEADTKECWCVNDRGDEQEGTRKVVNHEDHQPECYYNRTIKVHVTFFLRHDLDIIEPHLGKLKEVVHHHITQWLLIDREYIINLKVEPHSHKVHMLVVEFEMIKYGRVDLAATAAQLQHHMKHGRCHVLYDGHQLRADPNTLHMRHTFGPEIAVEPSRHSRCWIRMPFVIGAVVGGVFLIAVALMIIIVNRKRMQRIKRTRLTEEGDNFQKNLAFSNELYDQTNVIEGDIKKVKLEFTAETNSVQA